ncbi:MAG: hypothetical protein R2864_10655 [Syntrophotaleaceae bacterium]
MIALKDGRLQSDVQQERRLNFRLTILGPRIPSSAPRQSAGGFVAVDSAPALPQRRWGKPGRPY